MSEPRPGTSETGPGTSGPRPGTTDPGPDSRPGTTAPGNGDEAPAAAGSGGEVVVPPDPLLPVAPATGRSHRRTIGWLAIFALVVTLPLWVGDAVSGFLVELLVLTAVAQWWGLLVGHAGVISLMPAVFAGAGTYTWAALVTWGGLNPVLAIGGAAVATAALGLATGLAAQRLSRVSVALGGIIATAAGAGLAGQLDDVGASAEGRVITGVTTLGPTLRSSLATWLAVVVGVGSVAAAAGLRRSRYGLAAVAHRDDPEGAATLGIRSGPPRLAMWALGSVATGMAAAIIGFRSGVVRPAEAFGFTVWTVPAMVAATIGGLRTIAGPAVGALLYVAFDRAFGTGHHGLLLLLATGAALAVLAWAPQGVVGWAAGRLGSSPAAVWATISRWAPSRPTAPQR